MGINGDRSMAGAASRVSLATAFSRVLGLVREQVVAFFFGAGLATDAFVAAFRVPNLLRDLFAEGALSSAFVPVFKDKLEKEGNREAFRLANLTISSLILVVGIIVAVGIIIADGLIYISAKGFLSDAFKFDLTVNLTRLMFVYLLMVSISAVIMGMLNSRGIFGIPALAPAMFNLGMILSPIFLYEYFGVPIYTLAIGVVIGGVGQLVFQLPSLYRIGFRFRFMLNFADAGIRRIIRLISPMILGLSASRINILINTLLASLLIEGAMSYLNYAYRLMHFPLGVFGVALGTVILPRVSGEVAREEFEQLAKTFKEALGLALFLVIPSAAYLTVFSEDLIGLIYQRGAFDAEATRQTAQALFFYSFGLIGFAGVRVAAPVFYALGDARRPMYYSIASVAANIGLNFVFIQFWGFAGLAAATSCAGLVNFGLLWINLRKKIIGLDYGGSLLKAAGIILAAAAAMLIVYLCDYPRILDGAGLRDKILIVGLQIATAGLSYMVIARLLQIEEVGRLLRALRLMK